MASNRWPDSSFVDIYDSGPKCEIVSGNREIFLEDLRYEDLIRVCNRLFYENSAYLQSTKSSRRQRMSKTAQTDPDTSGLPASWLNLVQDLVDDLYTGLGNLINTLYHKPDAYCNAVAVKTAVECRRYFANKNGHLQSQLLPDIRFPTNDLEIYSEDAKIKLQNLLEKARKLKNIIPEVLDVKQSLFEMEVKTWKDEISPNTESDVMDSEKAKVPLVFHGEIGSPKKEKSSDTGFEDMDIDPFCAAGSYLMPCLAIKSKPNDSTKTAYTECANMDVDPSCAVGSASSCNDSTKTSCTESVKSGFGPFPGAYGNKYMETDNENIVSRVGLKRKSIEDGDLLENIQRISLSKQKNLRPTKSNPLHAPKQSGQKNIPKHVYLQSRLKRDTNKSQLIALGKTSNCSKPLATIRQMNVPDFLPGCSSSTDLKIKHKVDTNTEKINKLNSKENKADCSSNASKNFIKRNILALKATAQHSGTSKSKTTHN